MERICSRGLGDKCKIQEPITYTHKKPLTCKGCVHHTCQELGMVCAYFALRYGISTQFTLSDGNVINAVPFGSLEKSTDDPNGEFVRIVDVSTGEIHSKKRAGEFLPSGQKVPVPHLDNSI